MIRSSSKEVLAAIATPVDAEYRPDLRRLIDHGRWLLANGCSGLAPLGTTGEATSFGLRERLSVISGLAESGLPMDRCIIGIGAAAIEDACETAKMALQAACRGLLILPPFYYKTPSDEGLFRFFAQLAERLGGPARDLYLYHFPAMSAVPISIPLVVRLRTEFPDLFVGIKDSSCDLAVSRAYLDACPGLQLFTGDETLAPALIAHGGRGCISATANLSAPLIAARLSMLPGEDTTSLDRQIAGLRTLVSAQGIIPSVKALIAEHRGDPEWRRAVPPNLALGSRAATHLARQATLITRSSSSA